MNMHLTHVCLRVHRPAELLAFYTHLLGMRHLGDTTHDSGIQRNYVGYADGEGVLWNPERTYLEFEYNPGVADRQPYRAQSSQVYWKIGITSRDIKHAAGVLTKAGVRVSPPSQFQEVGFLAHLADPEGFSIELLQHDFENNFSPSPPDPGLPLGFPQTLGQVTLRVADAAASLAFYRDKLGMTLLSRQDVPQYGFTLYFLAWTTEAPPAQDVNAVENREWLWRRPYTTLELQHRPGQQSYTRPAPHAAGFLGLRAFSPRVRALREEFAASGLDIQDDQEDDSVMGLPSFRIHDPDGTPIVIHQIALF